MQLLDRYTKFEKFTKKREHNPYKKNVKKKHSQKGKMTDKRNFLIEEKRDYSLD